MAAAENDVTPTKFNKTLLSLVNLSASCEKSSRRRSDSLFPEGLCPFELDVRHAR